MIRKDKLKVIGWWLLAAAVIAAVVDMECAHYAGPAVDTQAKMAKLVAVVDAYWQAKRAVPDSVTALRGYAKNMNISDEERWWCDEWGNPFQYSVQDRTISLVSYGEDNRAGGSGEDADLKWHITLREGRSVPEVRATMEDMDAP